MSGAEEIWRPVHLPEFAHMYEVSNLGRVRSVDHWSVRGSSGKKIFQKGVIRSLKMQGGYPAVTLKAGKGMRSIKVHQLVAPAFIPNPNGFAVINHIDGVKTNNTPANLEWCTQTHNMHHAWRTGLLAHPPLRKGENHGSSKLNDDLVRQIRARIASGESKLKISIDMGVCHAAIWSIHYGKTWKHVT